jgi:hypothetical protein
LFKISNRERKKKIEYMLRQKDRGKKGKFIIYYKKKTKVWAQRASITLGDEVEPTEIDLGTANNA